MPFQEKHFDKTDTIPEKIIVPPMKKFTESSNKLTIGV